MNNGRRFEALENKVEQLVSQLAVLARTEQTSPEDLNPARASADLPHDAPLDSADICLLLDVADKCSDGLGMPPLSTVAREPSVVDQGLLSKAEAEALVNDFQRNFVPRFPFVVLPHTETSAQLQDLEPFLFLCVVAVAIGSTHPLRKTVAKQVMKHVTLRIVARSERSLELLRGLLVYTAWYAYPAQRNHRQLLLFVQLCISMLYDLGMHSKPSLDPDEQRALLGTYWLAVR
jgi:hypothetical protein